MHGVLCPQLAVQASPHLGPRPEDCLKKNATLWDEHPCGGGRELKLSPSVDSWDRFLREEEQKDELDHVTTQ